MKFAFLKYCIILLIALSGWNGLLTLPVVRNKVQPFEFVFLVSLPIFAYILLDYSKKKSTSILLFFNKIDMALLFFIGLTILNIATHPTKAVFLESLANIYVVVIYFIISRFVFIYRQYQEVLKSWKIAFVLIAVSVVIGNLCYYFLITDRFIHFYQQSPYFGSIARAKGFASSANCLPSVAIISYLMTYPLLLKYQKQVFGIALLFICLLAKTKEGIYFSGLSLFLFACYILYKKISLRKSLFIFVIGYIFYWCCVASSMLWVTCNGSEMCNDMSVELGYPFQFGDLTLRPTGYWYLFEASINVIKEFPLVGVGLGEFPAKIDAFKAMNLFPQNVTSYEPHDLYWGMVAQMGIGYIVFVVIFIVNVLKSLLYLWKKNIVSKDILFVFCIIFLFIGIETIGNVGALHFRHYWIVLGIFSGIYACKAEQSSENIKKNILIDET